MKTKKWKRALSVVLAGTMAVTALSAGMTAFAAEDDFYPEGVTAEQAGQAVTTVDTVLNDADLLKLVSGLVNGAQDVVKLPENAENLKDLAEQVVSDNLYTDAVINEIVKLVQGGLSSVLAGLDLGALSSVVGSLLGVYDNPSKYAEKVPGDYAAKTELAKYSTWDEVDWSLVSWGVDGTADSFYAALGASLDSMNTLLKLVLTDEGFVFGGIAKLLTISRVDGYEKVVLPLFETFGVTGKTAEEYNADKSTEGMLRNILEPVVNRVLDVCDAPATELLTILPQVAELIANDGIQAILDSLNITIGGGLKGIAIDAIKGLGIPVENDTINVGDVVAALAPDLDLSDINGLVKGLIPEGSFNWVDIDFAGLAALKGDAAKALVWVLEYAGQVVNANADMIKGAIPAIEDQALAGIVTPIIEKVLTTDPANFAALVINLLAPTDAPVSAYNYPTIEKVDFAYPEGVLYGEDAYAAAPAAIDGLLAGFGLNLADLVGGALYTNELINSVLGLYDTIAANQTVMDVFAALGINTDFAAVKAAAQAINVTDKASFIDALTTALSPFDDVLAMVLAGQDYDVFGYVVPGMDAYNTVVIPLLEVLGCTNVMSYADYQAAVANGASPLEAILTQALDRVDEILASPVDSIVEILPNLAYFLDSNNLSVMIKNVASPVIQLLSYVDIDAMAVVNDLLKAYNIPAIDDLDNDLAGLLNQVLGLIKINDAPLGIQLPAIDLHVLASYGTAEAYTSAMVIDGQNVQATRIVADKADVTGAVIGYLYSVLSDPATVDTIVGLLGESGSMVSGILSGLLGNGEAGFTNALFELLGLPMKGEDGSSDGNNNVNTGDTTVAVVAGAAVLAAGAVLLLARKKKEN